MCSDGAYEKLFIDDASTNGDIFEIITQLLHLHKMLPPQFHYTTLYKGFEKDRVPVKHVDEILNLPIHQGDDASDITWRCYADHMNCTSVKLREGFKVGEEGIGDMTHHKNVRFSYVCKDKTILPAAVKRSHHKDTRPVAPVFMDIISNNMVLDEQDIKDAYKRFQQSHPTLEEVQEHYLHNKRKSLQLRLHQVVALNKFLQNTAHQTHLLAHAPRSGKSITLMRIAAEAYKQGLVKRVLVVTPIVSTIDSFHETVRDYKEFASLKEMYLIRDKKKMPPPEWSGVAISSVQYFKTAGAFKSAESFDMIISDEAHIGSDTELSRKKLFDLKRPNLRYLIFASGTPCDTAEAFKIPQSRQYHWNDMDSHMMKRPNENRGLLKARHGDLFAKALESPVCSKDYSHVPGQVYLRSTFDDKPLKEFNAKHPDDKPLGYSWQSILALMNPQTGEGGFVLEGYSDGVDFLKERLRTLIHDDRNSPSTYKRCEKIRNQYGSRTFTGPDDFEVVLMFLPTHSTDANIAPLHRTLVEFLKRHGVWKKWHVVFDNASTSLSVQQEMEVARDNGKQKMVLLLGDKNTVGVTYHNCDLSIHLDKTTSLAFHTQKMARAGTDGPGKSIYITADMNIQRNFTIVRSKVKGAQKQMRTDTPEEAYEALCESGTFLVDPDEALGTEEAYRTMMMEMRRNITEEKDLLDLLDDPTDDALRHMLTGEYKFHGAEDHGEDMEGDNTIEKGERDTPEREKGEGEKIPTEDVADQINRTLGLMKTKVMPLNGLMCYRENKRSAVCDPVVFATDVLPVLMDLDKGIKLSHQEIVMQTIKKFREENLDVVERIEDMYIGADFNTVRLKIADHFIPSQEERKGAAEVPTPPQLVDEMLSKMPPTFWNTPKRVLEPCCGKGNFVIGIFQKFDEGMKDKYPEATTRHKVIVEECIHFTDISALNVMITRELLRCASGGVAKFYNSRQGDTLQMKWDEPFDLVVGNPPYSTDPSMKSTKPLYNQFYTKFIGKCRFLMFVVPSRWFMGGKGLDEFRSSMQARNDIRLIRHETDARKWFPDIDLKGGVNYMLIDAGYDGVCDFNGTPYDLSKYSVIADPVDHPMYDIANGRTKLTDIYKGRYFKVESNDPRICAAGDIPCYVSTILAKRLGVSGCLASISSMEYDRFWKVCTPKASGKGGDGFAKNMFVAGPDVIHSSTYMSFEVGSESEAHSLVSYLRTVLVNTLLAARKPTQNMSKDTLSLIPLVPLDRTWTDEGVREYLGV